MSYLRYKAQDRNHLGSEFKEEVLGEVIKGIKAFVEDYKQVLKKIELAPCTQKRIQKQYKKVKGSLEYAKTTEYFA